MKLGCLLAFLLALNVLGSVSTQASDAENTAWKSYRNAHYNFSVRYPDGWSKDEGFDKNGVRLAPNAESRFHLPPELSAGGAVGQPSEVDETRSRNIEEDFQSGLNALKDSAHVLNLVVLSKKATSIQGLRAIVSTTRYEDSSSGHVWFDKKILIHSDGDSPTYHLALHCSPDDAAVLVPLFDKIGKTFRILGPPA